MGGSSDYVQFIDDYLKFTTIYLLKNKSEIFEKFKDFVATAENFTGKRIKIVSLTIVMR